MRSRLIAITCILLCTSAATAAPVTLADRGGASLKVVVARNASDTVKESAQTLANYLQRISGGTFAVTNSDGRIDIAVGAWRDFPAMNLAKLFDPSDPFRGDEYLLRSHEQGLLLIGATDIAVSHAVWDLLHRLGHRQYFPTDTWEIVPKQPTLRIDVDTFEKPAFITRRIWTQWGTIKSLQPLYRRWQQRNRIVSSFKLLDLHIYHGMMSRKRDLLKEHPEYLGLVNGKRVSSKFCLSNPAVRDLFADATIEWFRAHPEAPSYSVEPSDGAGWCECEPCVAMGSISDRAVTLANHVAAAVRRYVSGTRYLGMLAYSRHADPPTIELDPSLIVSVTTGMRQSRLNVDEALAGWRAKATKHQGIYDYYSIHQWWRDMPGRPTGSNTVYVARSLKRFHGQGVRFFSAESGDNWGPNGLGYYLASRILWDTKETDRREAIIDEFVSQCFGSAAEPMAKFYALVDGRNKDRQRSDLLGQMYRLLDQAWSQSQDEAVRGRLSDLVHYTRYVELYHTYAAAKGDARQDAFETWIKHVYRMRHTGMVHTWALQSIPSVDKQVNWPKPTQLWADPDTNPWMSESPLNDEQIHQTLADGVANNPVLLFEDVLFSDELVPASPLKLAEVDPGYMYCVNRWDQSYYTWVKPGEDQITLRFRGKARTVRLYAAKANDAAMDRVEVNKPIDAGKLPESDEDAITLRTKHAGLHRIEVSQGVGAIGLSWDDRPMVLPSHARTGWGTQTLYFYVPRGTRVVAGDVGNIGRILSPDGQVRFEKKHQQTDAPPHFVIPVPSDGDGKLWKIEKYNGIWRLRTVPPYVTRSAAELMLPREVVERDRTQP